MIWSSVELMRMIISCLVNWSFQSSSATSLSNLLLTFVKSLVQAAEGMFWCLLWCGNQPWEQLATLEEVLLPSSCKDDWRIGDAVVTYWCTSSRVLLRHQYSILWHCGLPDYWLWVLDSQWTIEFQINLLHWCSIRCIVPQGIGWNRTTACSNKVNSKLLF